MVDPRTNIPTSITPFIVLYNDLMYYDLTPDLRVHVRRARVGRGPEFHEAECATRRCSQRAPVRDRLDQRRDDGCGAACARPLSQPQNSAHDDRRKAVASVVQYSKKCKAAAGLLGEEMRAPGSAGRRRRVASIPTAPPPRPQRTRTPSSAAASVSSSAGLDKGRTVILPHPILVYMENPYRDRK